MKVPFPSISDRLAAQAHMYICGKDINPEYGFIKCQTLKPYMLKCSVIAHYVDEIADPSRNPFGRPSRIDCDKFFVTSSVRYDDRLKTTSRPDVCQALYDDVQRELTSDGYTIVPINETELVSINQFFTKI